MAVGCIQGPGQRLWSDVLYHVSKYIHIQTRGIGNCTNIFYLATSLTGSGPGYEKPKRRAISGISIGKVTSAFLSADSGPQFIDRFYSELYSKKQAAGSKQVL
jgi:hypothetical protein